MTHETYIYRDPDNGFEPFYVGHGGVGRSSWWKMPSARKRAQPIGARLQRMFDSGVEPLVTVIPCESKELAALCEQELIAKYGRRYLGTGTLENLAPGSGSHEGRAMSDETRAKIANTLTGRKNPSRGKKIAAKLRGRTQSAERRAKGLS